MVKVPIFEHMETHVHYLTCPLYLSSLETTDSVYQYFILQMMKLRLKRLSNFPQVMLQINQILKFRSANSQDPDYTVWLKRHHTDVGCITPSPEPITVFLSALRAMIVLQSHFIHVASHQPASSLCLPENLCLGYIIAKNILMMVINSKTPGCSDRILVLSQNDILS